MKKFKNIKNTAERLIHWMSIDTNEVFEKFEKLPGAIRVGSGLQQFLYIPGTRKNKVLLVSHADTVFDNYSCKKSPYIDDNGIIRSKDDKIGIGADDRAGIAILWEMRNTGHSILIPNGEERGGIGSKFLMRDTEWEKEINSHQFAIEFDRCNDNDLVMYSVGSKDLLEYLKKIYIGYEYSPGSYTDICELCRTMAGVNISIGYYSQHSPNERLIIKEWENTLKLTNNLLLEKDIPFFKKEFNYEQRTSYYNDLGTQINHRKVYGVARKRIGESREYEIIENVELRKKLICCKFCSAIQTRSEVFANCKKCSYCGAYIA